MILCLRPVRGPGPTLFNSVFVGCNPRSHQITGGEVASCRPDYPPLAKSVHETEGGVEF